MAEKANGNGKAATPAEPEIPTTLAGKLAAIMGEINRVAKRGRNTFHKYDYVMEADLADEIRPLLAKYRIAIYPSAESYEQIINPVPEGGKDQGPISLVWMSFKIKCADSGEEQVVRFPGMGQDKGDKGIYKAITGATKYWMYKTFLVSTGDDPENDEEQKPVKGGKQSPQTQQQEQVLKDWNKFEQDSVRMKSMTTAQELESFLKENEKEIQNNAYQVYYGNLAEELRAKIKTSN